MPRLLIAKIQNAEAIPNTAIKMPPSAGPTARLKLKPTLLAAVALSRSRRGTSSGTIEAQAGEVRAPATPRRKVVVSKAPAVARLSETRPAKATERTMTAISTTMRRRRASMTSASAPAGRVKRKSGSETATWTSDTASGLALRLVIIQPEPVSNTAVPRLETTLAVQIAVKAAWLNAPQRSGGSTGAAVESVPTLTLAGPPLGQCRIAVAVSPHLRTGVFHPVLVTAQAIC